MKSCSCFVLCDLLADLVLFEMYWIYSPVSQIEDITAYPRKKKDMAPSIHLEIVLLHTILFHVQF